jgi:hypothetical protein
MTDRGTCHYATKAFECEMPAEHHILVDDDTCSWACSDHFERALDQLKPIDHHPYSDICWLSTELEPSMRWRHSSPEHIGFCYMNDDSAADGSVAVVDLSIPPSALV